MNFRWLFKILVVVSFGAKSQNIHHMSVSAIQPFSRIVIQISKIGYMKKTFFYDFFKNLVLSGESGGKSVEKILLLQLFFYNCSP
jgi:hypothetical protein